MKTKIMTSKQKEKERVFFRELRERMQLSTRQLGDVMGIRQDNIARIENGTRGGGPTRTQGRFLKTLFFIANNGLLLELVKYLQDGEEDGQE